MCTRTASAALAIALCLGATPTASQPEPPAAPRTERPTSTTTTITAEPSGEAATLTYFNRPIITLRARVLGRPPSERIRISRGVLDEIMADPPAGRVSSRMIQGGAVILVGTRIVIGVSVHDVDELTDERLDTVVAQTVGRLQQALDEATEARHPGLLLRAAILAAAVILAGLAILVGLGWVRRTLSTKLAAVAEATAAKYGIADLHSLRASRLLDFQRGLVTAVTVALQFVVVYSVLTIVFRRFPYTRPWGESLRGFLVTTVRDLGLELLSGVPGLVTVALIFVITRFVARVVGVWFTSIERGRIKARYIYPETAQPTRRLATTLLWLFALVVAYPYMPGSQTEAFKGISVFLGLILTFGSSGLVNQVMSGFMVTYSRAVRVGDFVKLGDVEGTVVHLGVLSTKVRTLLNEEITIPNAVVVSQTAVDYSRLSDSVFTQTSVTIGYDAPWRQVHAMLLAAAERTPGLRPEPAPRVYQTALEDFYVRYSLWVCLDRQEERFVTMNALHANIQDVFNEHGVQIMSPNYLADPAKPKVVPRADWYAAPARPEPPAGADGESRP